MLTNPELVALICGVRWPRMHVLSDLHLDVGPYRIPADLDFDILLAVGDIGPVEAAVPWLASIGKPVVYVLGNHEHYDGDLDEVAATAKTLARGTAVHVLHKQSVEICGVRFLGAMLWTNFGSMNSFLIESGVQFSNDFHKIYAKRYASGPLRNRVERLCRRIGCASPAPGQFHPVIANLEHQDALAWLDAQLKQPFDGPTVVLTHHSPTFESLRAFGTHDELLHEAGWKYQDADLARVGNYASNLTSFLNVNYRSIDLWCHGHLHRGVDVIDGGVRVLCNPRGYHVLPFTKESARAFELLGNHRVSDEDVASSQAHFDANPFQGDAPDFDARLVVDLTDGFAKPLELAMCTVVENLEAIHHSTAELLPYLDTIDTVPAKCVREVFGGHCEQFNKALNETLEGFAIHLDGQVKRMDVLRQLRYPAPMPDRPLESPDRPIDLRYQYIAQVGWMTTWINWAKELPNAAERNLNEWFELAQQVLQTLDQICINAFVEPPERIAFRRVDACPKGVAIIVNAEDDVAPARAVLNKKFNQHPKVARLLFQISDGPELLAEEPRAIQLAMRTTNIIRERMRIK